MYHRIIYKPTNQTNVVVETNNRLKNTALVLLSTLFLISCGGGSGGANLPNATISSGFLSAAPIDLATCELFKVVGGSKSGVSLQTVSSSAGKVEFTDIDYTGTALIECTGGNYNDEATDTQKTPPTLNAVVDFSPNGNFAVTPLTQIAFQMDTNLDNVLSTHNATVATAFGMDDKNISEILPADVDSNNITDTDAGHYASALAGLSKLEAEGNEGTNLSTLITNLATDLADGTFDAATNGHLMSAFTNLQNLTGKNISTRKNDAVIIKLRQSIADAGEKSALNDTGITWGGDYPSGNNADCTGEAISAQDCSHGRDAKALAGTLTKVGGGAAGFDFTKLGSDGSVLTIQNGTWASGGTGTEAAGTKWSCVKDNVTGLVWEVKTDAGTADSDTTDDNHTNIHHKHNAYRWGGKTAIGKNHVSKEGTYYDDWSGLVDGTNTEKLCGFTDWKVPSINELITITHKGKTNPSIDENYFPNTSVSGFFSSSPYAYVSIGSWIVNFDYGYDSHGFRTNSYRVRLVRGGE